jgi:hypothetical protein
MKKILPFLIIGIILFSCSPNSVFLSPKITPTLPPTPHIQFLGTNTYFTFLATDLNRPDICFFTIRLPMEISSSQLALLSQYIYKTEGQNCSAHSYIMSFYLPDDVFNIIPTIDAPSDHPWAESDVGFDGRVTIRGQILEDDMPSMAFTFQEDKAFLGIWLDARELPRTITITLQDATYEMISTYEDGTVETKDLFVELVDGENRLFETLNGEYMVVKSNGNLAFYNDDGVIYEIEK